MTGYILKFIDSDFRSVEYITSPKTYQYQYEPYACFGNKSEAHIFKSLKIAERVSTKLEKCANIHGRIEVIEIDY